MVQNISVPDIGDFKDVEVIEVLVKPGDQIKKNDPLSKEEDYKLWQLTKKIESKE